MKNWKIYIWIVIVYLVMQFGSLPVSQGLIHYFDGLGLSEADAKFQGVAWGLFLSNLIAAPIIIWLTTRNKKFWDIFKGKKPKSSVLEIIGWGFLGFFMAMAGQMIAGIIEVALGVTEGSENTEMLSLIAKQSPIIIFSIVFFAPLFEEIVFRRVLFGGIYTKTNFWIAGILSAVVFSLVHGEPQHLLIYLAPGLVFAFIYTQTRSIFTSMISHFLMNSFVMVLQLNMEKIIEFQEKLQKLSEQYISFH